MTDYLSLPETEVGEASFQDVGLSVLKLAKSYTKQELITLQNCLIPPVMDLRFLVSIFLPAL